MTTEAFKKSTLLIEQATTDATAVPEWLNEEFLLKHLQNSFPEKLISIQNFHVKKASAIGENYTSVIYRVNVVFADESSVRFKQCHFGFFLNQCYWHSIPSLPPQRMHLLWFQMTLVYLRR